MTDTGEYQPPAVFHGSEEEARALVEAVDRNCGRATQTPCEAHKAIALDQRFVDHLLMERRKWSAIGETEGPEDEHGDA